MNKRVIRIFCILFFLVFAFTYAQKKIENFSYEELANIIESRYDPVFVKPYIKAYLKKAKKDKDLSKIKLGYTFFLYETTPEEELIYDDSLLLCAKQINSDIALGEAYDDVGNIYYGKKRYSEALDHYIIANNFAQKTSETYLKNEIKYSIGNIKLYLGFYKEALAIFTECAAYFKGNSKGGYINSIEAIGVCYNQLKNYKLAKKFNKLALDEAIKTNDTISENYYYYYEGITEYGLKDYKSSISFITRSLPEINKLHDFAGQTLAYFYLGKDYLALGDSERAFIYFKKVDNAFKIKKYTQPDLRENYEILINNAKKTGNVNSQLYYINQLMAVDSVLNTDFKYLSGKIHKEYDTKALISEKKEIEAELANQNTMVVLLYATIALLFILSLILLYRYFSNQRKYKQRFNELMQRIEHQQVTYVDKTKMHTTFNEEASPAPPDYIDKTKSHAEKESNKKPDINPDLVASILEQLSRFEQKNKFLQKDLTLNDLAIVLNTNGNYLSKIINYYKEKSYTNYLNELRVDYIITSLRKNPKFRNYTIKALAEEAGFSNAQHFSKAFFARTGLYPSFFVTELINTYGFKVLEDA